MKNMNQIVFVVNDTKEKKILGVFNEYDDAQGVAMDMATSKYNGTEISITPVLVDTVNWVTNSRKYYLNQQEVFDALQDEIDLAMPTTDEDEDEDEDEEDYEDEEFDEDEDLNEDEDEDEEIPEIAEFVYNLLDFLVGED